jgi:hypothetical protein
VAQLLNSLVVRKGLADHSDSFGFTVGQTTLLGMVSGAIEIITIYSSTWVIKWVWFQLSLSPVTRDADRLVERCPTRVG